MKLWGGRFNKPTAKQAEEFTASIHFDKNLAPYDITGSIAHAKMLAYCALISEQESKLIIKGLTSIQNKINAGEIIFSVADEDIHMNIERLLFQEIGEVAGKLHTARSRNDQVALDLHLYLRDQLLILINDLCHLQQTLIEKAQQHIHTVMPGYTHLQHAQPVSFAHHLLAYFSMLQRDIDRLIFSWNEVNVMPLGAGAIAGTRLPIDRHYTAEILGFDAVYTNSMDAVSNRDFIISFLANASLIMMHLSRFSEELILWSAKEFSFIEFDDSFCTGSSMMPQKKNPDVAELVRGKTGRVYGSLLALLTTMKALPLSYNRDMQEDKEGLFDTVKTLNYVVTTFDAMINAMHVHEKNMQACLENDFIFATSLSDYLVMKGMPFRKTHEIIGKIVQHCLINNLKLTDLSLEKYQQFSSLFDEDLYQAIDVMHVLSSKKIVGSTGFGAIKSELQNAQHKIFQNYSFIHAKVIKVTEQED